MGVIYLDHNFVSDIAGHTRVADADAERGRVTETVRAGEHRFAVSVWNMYETARAGRQETKDGCIELVSDIRPLYCANSRLIQVQEVVRYAASRYDDHPYRVEGGSPFLETPAQMWATFAGQRSPAIPFVGESFRDGVEMLAHSDPRRYLDAALDDGPEAAAAGRQAFVEGVVERDQQLIDQHWLMELLPERNQADNAWIDQRRRETLVDFVLEHIDDAYLHCPALHAEEQIFRHRVASRRRLRRSDGIDVQFGVLAVAYCDAIVTADGAFREMLIAVATAIGSQCRVLSRMAEM